jgi:hypothetical protein
VVPGLCAGLVIATTVVCASPAAAQDAPAPAPAEAAAEAPTAPAAPADAPAPPPPPVTDAADGDGSNASDTGLTPEEEAEFEKAAAADAQAIRATTPAPVKPSPGGVLQSLNPDIAFITDVAVAAFSEKDPLQTGGHDPSENGFTLQQVELSVGANVDPYLRFDANIVFAQFGVEVEEAYATTLALPYHLQARAGQFLTRFGRQNGTHPHAWDFVDQPFALGRVFGGEGNRGLGAELSWLTPLPWYVELVGAVTDAGGEATARSFFGASDPGVEKVTDFQLTLAAKQFFDVSEDFSVMWGLSYAGGPNDSGHDNRSEIYGTDLYLKYRPITHGSTTVVALQAEYFYRRRQVPGDVLTDHGAYAYGFWRFARRWGAAVRWELGTPARDQAGDVADDPLDPAWIEDRQRVSANVTFWPTEFSRFRLQGAVDDPGWRDDPVWAVMLAAEFVVGAHGSHKF